MSYTIEYLCKVEYKDGFDEELEADPMTVNDSLIEPYYDGESLDVEGLQHKMSKDDLFEDKYWWLAEDDHANDKVYSKHDIKEGGYEIISVANSSGTEIYSKY